MNYISAEEVSNVDKSFDCEEKDEVDEDELERDRLVEEVVIYAVPPSDCRQPLKDVIEVENEIQERLASIGVNIMNIRHKSKLGKHESSLVRVTPAVNLNRIWGRRLGLKNCAVVEFKKPDAK